LGNAQVLFAEAARLSGAYFIKGEFSMESSYAVTFKDEVMKIELTGHLDATNSEGLLSELKRFAGQKAGKIVFMAKDLEYISSAGLRVIIFAKRMGGADARLFLVGAPDEILDVIRMSGLDNFMTLLDDYPA
jgi:anti-anti-sigma factor